MSIVWKIKQDWQTHIMPNPSSHDPKLLGAAKNHLRKLSRKANEIFERAGL